MTDSTDPLLSVVATPPKLEPKVVADALLQKFRLQGELQPLVSERDQNFRLTTPGGDRYVAKIVSAAEPTLVTEFQIAALQHLENKQMHGVPRVVPSVSGAARVAIAGGSVGKLSMRVVTWLDGRLMEDRPLTVEFAAQFGAALARLDVALADLEHPGDRQVLLWDAERALALRDLTGCIDDSSIRSAVEAALWNFENRVLPRLDELPRQVIHNDANPGNVLLTESDEHAGFIDFGDMLRAARIIEVSTAAAYLRSNAVDPLRFIKPFVSAYHQVNPLSDSEIHCLFDLIQTRLSMTLTILYWRLTARDKSDAYRIRSLETEKNAYEFLCALNATGREAFSVSIRDALLGYSVTSSR